MTLPTEVQSIITTLQKADFGAFVVGGCVRDLILKRQPQDWDITTNAQPEDLQKLFPNNFYNNRFGTVTVLTDCPHPALKEIEVTTYRVDVGYSDQRHPDEVVFTPNLLEDLARRDFTINAMALAPAQDSQQKKTDPLAKHSVVIDNLTIIDPFGGLKDIHARTIRAVGDPAQRFSEDALRLLRAIRFAAQLDFDIETQTLAAITQHAATISAVSPERVRDELSKLVMTDHPEPGFNLLQKTGLLTILLPELAEGVGVEQNKHHIYTVFDHNIKSLQFAANFDYAFHVRLAALLHDIGKPRTRRKQGNDYTFYAHDIVGARMAEKLLHRLRFPTEISTTVTHLIRHHMFYYDVGKVTDAGARRLLRRVGPQHFDDLIKLRIAERKGSGVPKAEPYRLRHLQFLVEKAAQEPITTSQLAINGADVMRELNVRPGPIIGGILNALLAEVLNDPRKNKPELLLARAHELKDTPPDQLKALGEAAKDEEAERREDEIKRKYHV